MRARGSALTACSWLLLASACGSSGTRDAGASGDGGLLAARDADAVLHDGRAGEPTDADEARTHTDDPVDAESHDARVRDAAALRDAGSAATDANDSRDAGRDGAATDGGGFVLPPATLETLPYARGVVRFDRGSNAGFGQTSYPDIVLGPPNGAGSGAGSLDVLSLGVGGSIVLDFGDYEVIDGPGIDLIVFENAFWPGGDSSQVFAEPAEVALSEDGESWHRFECDTGSAARAGCAGITPVQPYDPLEVYPLDPELTGGDGFDLDELGLVRARYVRITDLSTSGDGNNAGFDLDAVGLVHFDLR